MPTTPERELRVLQVLKFRGSGFRTGEHAYRITADGFAVFPRLADEYDTTRYPLSSERASTGIAALDEALCDGYWPGAVTLIAGPTGASETLIGLHFLFQGANNSEPGILATFQEHPTQLARIAGASAGISTGQTSKCSGVHPSILYVDEWVLRTSSRASNSRTLVASSSTASATSSSRRPDEVRFREMMYSLSQRLARRGVSLMMTYEHAELFRLTRLSDIGMSHLADNVVVLQYVRAESDIKRALLVLKTRASDHHPEIREFSIHKEGIALGNRIDRDDEFG